MDNTHEKINEALTARAANKIFQLTKHIIYNIIYMD